MQPRVTWGDSFFRAFKPTQAVQSMAARSGLAGFGGGGMASVGGTVNLQAGGTARNPATLRAHYQTRERYKKWEADIQGQIAELQYAANLAGLAGDYALFEDTMEEIRELQGELPRPRGPVPFKYPFSYDRYSGTRTDPYRGW